MTPEQSAALKEVMDEIDRITPDEFKAEIEKHKGGDIPQIFEELTSFINYIKDADHDLYKLCTNREASE